MHILFRSARTSCSENLDHLCGLINHPRTYQTLFILKADHPGYQITVRPVRQCLVFFGSVPYCDRLVWRTCLGQFGLVGFEPFFLQCQQQHFYPMNILARVRDSLFIFAIDITMKVVVILLSLLYPLRNICELL